MEPSQVTVIIPAYNEESDVGRLVHDIKEVSDQLEIIVIDDGSSDRTAEVAKAAGALVIRHPYNMGNGAAIKTAVRAAKRDTLVFMDGDWQHDPKDIPRLLRETDRYDMVVGARNGKMEEALVRRLGNWCMSRVASFLSEMPIADLTSGFRAVRRERVVEFLHLLPNRYSYPTTITICMIRSAYPVKYVLLTNVRRRRSGQSHIHPIRDGFRFLIMILRMIMLFDPLKIFLPASLGILGVSAILFVYNLVVFNRIKDSFVVVAVIGFLTFFFGLLADQLANLRRGR